jgi:hypothetical protein
MKMTKFKSNEVQSNIEILIKSFGTKSYKAADIYSDKNLKVSIGSACRYLDILHYNGCIVLDTSAKGKKVFKTLKKLDFTVPDQLKQRISKDKTYNLKPDSLAFKIVSACPEGIFTKETIWKILNDKSLNKDSFTSSFYVVVGKGFLSKTQNRGCFELASKGKDIINKVKAVETKPVEATPVETDDLEVNEIQLGRSIAAYISNLESKLTQLDSDNLTLKEQLKEARIGSEEIQKHLLNIQDKNARIADLGRAVREAQQQTLNAQKELRKFTIVPHMPVPEHNHLIKQKELEIVGKDDKVRNLLGTIDKMAKKISGRGVVLKDFKKLGTYTQPHR